MAAPKGNRNGLRFGEGQKSEGAGRKPLSELEKSVREATRSLIAASIEKFQAMTKTELERFCKNKNKPAFELGVARAYLNYTRNGDFKNIDSIVARVLGKSVNIIESKNVNAEVDSKHVKDFINKHGLGEREIKQK